ncbi:uncharacterized protein [Dysidea avara]|uniref:uncharacterized protein n=1 Tax=Dysidea avara TaxID=196820 RepID=UPI0033317609
MKFAAVLVVMVILAFITNIDGQPVCTKIDQCSCRLSGVEPSGVINLHDIVSGKHEPEFVVEGKSEQTNLWYNFSYNPCFNFSDYGCPNTGICQTHDGIQPYDLGNLDTTEFAYGEDENHTIVALYLSKDSTTDGRVSLVGLVCDESEMKGRFVFNGETLQQFYTFLLYTRCACPGKCTKSLRECRAKDSCSCEMSDGTGTINLHSLDNPSSPLRDEVSPTNTFLYNPCSAMTNPSCKNNSLCEEQGESIIPLGRAYYSRFVFNNNQLAVQYIQFNDSFSTVNLICDHNQTDKPVFRAVGDGYTYNLYSVCACPNGCGGPPSNGTCDQTDSCTCKSTSDGAVINLHDLDNPYAPLTAKDNEGHTYYYNPCSGIHLEDSSGKCDGAAACQYDPYHDVYYNIGNNSPRIDYDATSKSFTFHYTGDGDGHSIDVRMICDHDVATTILAVDGDIPNSAHLKLVSKYACTQ